MRYDKVHLPNGIVVNVSQVFGGFRFHTESHEQYDSFPPEWTVSLYTKQHPLSDPKETTESPWTVPTMDRDAMYLSSLSLPSCQDLKPSSAPTRIMAMVLWVIFSWYFQEPDPTPPDPIRNANAGNLPGGWQLNVEARGMLSRKDQAVKIERLGILSSRDTSVGLQEGLEELPDLFISQKVFWQLDPRIHVFSISSVLPTPGQAHPPPSGSLDNLGIGFPFGAGPKTAGTFLPPYYPPQALQYVFTDKIRHPLRPKAYKQGEVFYVRFIPNDGEYLTFRVPVLPSKNPVQNPTLTGRMGSKFGPDLCLDPDPENDVKLVYNWVQRRGPDTALPQEDSIEKQTEFLKDRMRSQNSFPALVCWDSQALGYFELFWVLEDTVGKQLGGAGDYDRGVRCFFGNEAFLEKKQLERCTSSLVHHCWLHDQRSHRVFFECKADNQDIITALLDIGFSKVKEIQTTSEHNMILRIDRADWLAPVI